MLDPRRYSIAGFTFSLDLPDPRIAHDVHLALREFRTDARAETIIEAHLDPSFRSAEVIELPPLSALAGGEGEIHGPDFVARISPDRAVARVQQARSAVPVASVIKLLLAERIVAAGGLLLHSACVATDAAAAVFVGQSGAGKSTLAEFATRGGLGLVADELVAVVPDGGGYRAYGTPWNIGRPATAPVRAVGILEHAPAHEVQDIAASDVLRVVVANTLMADRTPVGRAAVFANAAAMLGALRSVKLRFARELAVADVLRAALDG